jgi:hypothetical protein
MCRTDHPSKWGQFLIIMRLYPGAGVIIFMGTILLSSSDDSNIFSGTPWEHFCDQDCLNMHTFAPFPQFFCLFKPVAHVCTLEDGWGWAECLLCFFPPHVQSHVINLLSLPSPCLFTWRLGAGGQTSHMESQEFGPWVQNSNFLLSPEI